MALQIGLLIVNLLIFLNRLALKHKLFGALTLRPGPPQQILARRLIEIFWHRASNYLGFIIKSLGQLERVSLV